MQAGKFRRTSFNPLGNKEAKREVSPRVRLSVVVFAVFALVVSACTTDEADSTTLEGSTTTAGSATTDATDVESVTTVTEEPAAPPLEVPDEVLFVAPGPVVGLSPDGAGQNNGPSSQVFLAVYDGLTYYAVPTDADVLEAALAVPFNEGLVEPRLAESWDVSDDRLVYTFHLRPNVVSPFGNTMTAADVVWSLEKHLDAGTTTNFILGVLSGVTSPDQMVAIDDMTVQVTLEEPNSTLILAMGWRFAVVDSVEAMKHATEEDPYAGEWLDKNTAGFGPYHVISMDTEGREVILEGREDYWAGPPAMSRVVQRAVEDPGTRSQLLLSGEAAYAGDPTPRDLALAEEHPDITVTRGVGATNAFLALTAEVEPWSLPEVRRAIAQAIPYDEILASVFDGTASAQESIFSPFMPEYDSSLWVSQTDLDAASEVLGNLDAELTLSYAEGLPVDEQIAILVQDSLRRAGLEITLDKQLRADFDSKKYGRTGELQFLVDAIDAPAILTPAYYLFIYATEGGFLNFANYTNPELDEILATINDPAASDTDIAAAIAAGQKLSAEELPIIPVAFTGRQIAHASYLAVQSANTGSGFTSIASFVAANE
jgi:peptide/nickel transport system substrate-binding protein